MSSLFRHILAKTTEQFSSRSALVETSGREMSYGEIEGESNRISNFLLDNSIKSQDRIGLFLPKCIEAVVSIFSVLKTQGAYIPLDTNAPLSRAHFILNDAQAKGVFLLEKQLEVFLEGLESSFEVIPVPQSQLNFIKFKKEFDKPLIIKNESPLAFILYTSGSTGTPKGVMISDENVASFVNWCSAEFNPNAEDVFSSLAMLHFDLSVLDIFVAIKHGAKIVLFNSKESKNPLLISSLIEKNKITFCYATPSFFTLLQTYGKPQRYDHSSLRTVLFAGEVFPIEKLKQLRLIWPNPTFYNLYGPTETNVVTYFKVEAELDDTFSKPLPIGKVCSHVEAKIFEGDLIELTPGAKGELIINGLSVTPGYLNLPDKTASVFITGKKGKLWYRTGDIVSVDESHNIIFSGRRDRMVKRRGYRIELDEIENALNKNNSLLEVGVKAFSDDTGGTSITAYLCIKPDHNQLSTNELKKHCSGHLPVYMVPDEFKYLDILPKTSTFKIDYQQLKP